MICGKKLVYMKNARTNVKCAYCGKEELTDVFCLKGHYVCDVCHKGDILDAVTELCMKSPLKDPIALLLEIFDLKGLNMHGPEYHAIVPAVLVTAYINATGSEDRTMIQKAVLRGREVKGGMCGSHGACGAGIGVGIAYSVLHGVTPYSGADRGEAMRMTAFALLEIGKYGGPRCCKRDSALAVKTAAEHFGVPFEDSGERYICRQFSQNKMCIVRNAGNVQNARIARIEKCPFYPSGAEL
jgi:hypothetical protein